MNFKVLFTFSTSFGVYRFTTLANDSRHAWSLFGANSSRNYQAKNPPMRVLVEIIASCFFLSRCCPPRDQMG